MKTTCRILVIMVFLASCASTPYNPSKPEMSVPENTQYKTQPKTFNQFHDEWQY